ncbi:hypothetical protein SDC9_171226 [bioreactor metagenome]|uniref:HTH cro/C1-type domain-containing protein n=1 Tax=bioreactor metagenome TaxID=1076179 RepID=A0A645GJD8_9ZZZZ
MQSSFATLCKGARVRAAEYNDKLKNREGAAEALLISADSLKNYELGLLKTVPNDVVVRMADLYNAPELLNNYCISECPIGSITRQPLEIKTIERLALQLIRNTNGVDSIRDTLADITADGSIERDERPKLHEILGYLSVLKQSIDEIELYCHKEGLL